MNSVKHIVLLFFISIYIQGFSLTPPPKKTSGAGIRLFFGPAYGFYQINKNHADRALPRMSAVAGFRKEVRIDREYKFFFLFGADYYFQSYGFKSYYFTQDTLKLYNKTFEYDYAVFHHEIQVPSQVKLSFTKENNSLFSPYITFGYHLRYLLPGNLTVSQNGNTVLKDEADPDFRNKLFFKKINSGLQIGAGWQKNSVNNSRGSFFAELNFRYGFSQYFLQKKYMASSMFVNSTHLALLIGLRF